MASTVDPVGKVRAARRRGRTEKRKRIEASSKVQLTGGSFG